MADETLLRDGVRIPLPQPNERTAFAKWLQDNKVNDPFHPDQHYDNVSAFRAGIGRDPASAHFPDTYKLPGHPSFSDQSQYATGPNAQVAGHWLDKQANGEQGPMDVYLAGPTGHYQAQDPSFGQMVLNLFNAIAGAKSR